MATRKWIFTNELPPELSQVVGEIAIAAGQLEYVLMLAYKRASGERFAVAMLEAERLQRVRAHVEELKKFFAKQILDDETNNELDKILSSVLALYEERHTVIHAVFVEMEDGNLARFYSNRPTVRLKAINYGVEVEKLQTLRDNLRRARDDLNSFTKKWLLGKRLPTN